MDAYFSNIKLCQSCRKERKVKVRAMSIQNVKREFSDLCAKVSLQEFERNPEIEREIGRIKRMITKISARIQKSEKKVATRTGKNKLSEMNR